MGGRYFFSLHLPVMKIKQINDIALSFLQENLSTDVKIIKVNKQGELWKVIAEVFEDSAFIKSIGLNTNVKDRYLYEIELDGQLEIIAYSRVEDAMQS